MIEEGFQIPFGVQPVNPTPVDTWSGPYNSILEAVNSIPIEIRFPTMEVRILDPINGNKKYWFKDGISDGDLIEFSSGLSITGGTGNSRWKIATLSGDTSLHPRWNDSADENIYGIDLFNFNTVPSGLRDANTGVFSFIGERSYIWSTNGTALTLYNNSSLAYIHTGLSATNGYSVRALRTATSGETNLPDGSIIQNVYRDSDNYTYTGVKIGDQIWFRENLKTTKYSNGNPILNNLSNLE